MTETNHELITGDCLNVMQSMPENSVDLVLCSPPYEDARTYGIGFNLKGQDWVDWAVAKKNGRNSISIDVRDCENAGKTLIEKRLAEVVVKE
jgi:DNA modification methylase